MPAKKSPAAPAERLPRLCLRKSPSSDHALAYATFNGQFVSFGPAGDSARRRFDEFLARWLANDRRLPNAAAANDPDDVYRIEDLVADYLAHSREFYVDPVTRKPTGEHANVRAALAAVDAQFAQLPATEFGPLALRAVRDQMVQGGRLCRKEINARVHRIRRAFRWAASMERVPAAVPQALATVDGLKRGKTEAKESPLVRPVPDAEVRTIVAHLCPTVRAMVWLQWFTGCRPGEACALRWSMIDRSGPVWIATFAHHKTAWRGRARVLAIGPRAQEHLRPLLRPVPDAFVFSPARALTEQRAEKRQRRRTKVSPAQQRRAAAAQEPADQAADHFTVHSYRRAIERSVRAANADTLRAFLLEQLAELRPPEVVEHAPTVAEHGAWRRLPADVLDRVRTWLRREEAITRASVAALTTGAGAARIRVRLLVWLDEQRVRDLVKACAELELLRPWGPNRLRHSAATRLRREEGIEAARVVLGHARAVVTEVYAEADHERSRRIMERLG